MCCRDKLAIERRPPQYFDQQTSAVLYHCCAIIIAFYTQKIQSSTLQKQSAIFYVHSTIFASILFTHPGIPAGHSRKIDHFVQEFTQKVTFSPKKWPLVTFHPPFVKKASIRHFHPNQRKRSHFSLQTRFFIHMHINPFKTSSMPSQNYRFFWP